MVSKYVTFHVKEYKCKNCKEQVTTNGNGNLIELTSKYKEINAELEKIHANRIRKKANIAIDLPQKPIFQFAD